MSAAGQPRRLGARNQRLRAPRSHGLSVSTDDMWARLLAAIIQIQQHDISQLSYEEHYRYAYNLILVRLTILPENQQGDMLYAGVKKQVQTHLMRQCSEQLEPLFPLDPSAATQAHQLFKTYLAKSSSSSDANISSTLKLLPNSPDNQLILSSIAASERYLSALTHVWEDHTSCMSKLRDVLKYLDRVYVTNRREQPIWDLGLDLFRDTIVLSQRVPAVFANLITTFLRQIYCERQGASVERRTLKSTTDMLLTLTCLTLQSTRVTVYQRDFEPILLITSAEYYQAESLRLLESKQATYYLQQVENRLNEEQARVNVCLSSSTLPALRATVERHLLTDHLDEIIQMPDGGIVALLESDRREELERMYRMMQLVPAGLPTMNKVIREYATTRGRAINETARSTAKGPDSTEASSASTPTAELALNWVQEVMRFKTQFDQILYTSFHGDKFCEAAINEAFDSFINMNPRAAEFISLFIDEHLKKGSKMISDGELEQILDRIVMLFRYVHEKDMFERYYKLHLTRRLLHGRSVSDDAERGMIAKLKVECGHGYVQKLQGMLNDMKLSQEVLNAFHKYMDREQKSLPFQLNVHVLTAIYWPIAAPQEKYQWPDQLQEACNTFEQYYFTRHRGRVLTWQPNLGSADIRVRFRTRTHELSVSSFAMMVLLLFEKVEDDCALSFQDIQQSTHIGESDLQRTLQSLACAKYKILRKEPRGRDVCSTDVFYFNSAFTCPLARIKIAQVAAKVETPTERKETTAKVEEERKNQVDACVVRVMKSRKTLSHNDLVNEVIRQLLPRFQPTPTLIKKRIEALLEREFLEVSLSSYPFF
ncbi:hypothetical protein MYAM1_002001 [Malassezia yamatoensis]|uniref:Cullin family profile domain-containing protein n=1 Tax=Malassezia yamatoensis TaxID=253288 RepID=A0AAJ5YT22_9BASI|nr:hypothetical protein MYAM1_002001 [Malassezia yamatoensis]